MEKKLQEQINESLETASNVKAPDIPVSAEPTVYNPLTSNWSIFGYVLIGLAVLTLVLTQGRLEVFNAGFFGLHTMTFVLGLGALFSYKNETKWFPTRLNLIFVWLVFFQAMAFVFNKEMTVFPPSVMWLQVLLGAHAATLIALTFRDFLPEKVLNALFFLLGVGFILDIYFLISTASLLIFGFAGLLFLGLSIYAYAPLFKVIYTLIFVVKSVPHGRKLGTYFAAGASFSIITTLIFVGFWTNMSQKAHLAHQNTQSPLPAWVRVAQVLPPSVMTEKLLKSGLSGRAGGGFLGGDFDANNDRFHDPLVWIANQIKPLPELSEDERSNALRAIFDARLEAERRLWSGDNLKTATVKTSVGLFPAHRLAFTELELTIENTSKNRSWDRNEAIYTFRMPEGGTVTALTLWVNGEPCEGILTTKEKAAAAYETIVGREMRDPSVVHWQEGNSVSVRVFPCTPEEARHVKIGFTIPLKKEANSLIYKNIEIEGVPMTDAKTELIVQNAPPELVASNEMLTEKISNYDPDWTLKMPCPPLANDGFSFNGKAYKLAETTPLYLPFDAAKIWLDVSKAWSKADFDKVWAMTKHKPVFVFDEHQPVQLTEDNHAAYFDKAHGLNFSVFPIHRVAATDLVIAKSKPSAPNFTDLKGSVMADEMARLLPLAIPVRVFCLNNESSIYLKTLQELRVTHQTGGDLATLQRILTEKTFPITIETPTQFALPNNQLAVVETTEKTATGAPDHLLRLFAYNKILAMTGKNYFRDSVITEGGTPLAQLANVVSPVSSLIVLETQADYDRFDIQKSKDTLGNAALNKAGAAPEPHEWALLLLGLSVMVWVRWRRM
jgi:XrtN system VIT domain protein